MPGLFGIVNYFQDNNRDILQKMEYCMNGDKNFHTDTWLDEELGIGIGINSLDIFNYEPQPVGINIGLRMFVFGELVNSEDLRKNLVMKGFNASSVGNASLVLMQYLIEGLESFQKINGSLAIAFWDNEKKELTLVPDRFGLRPIYYSEVNGVFAFASEIKSLLSLDFVPKNIDEEAILEFLTFEQLRNKNTFLKNIKKIPLGSVLTYRQNKILIEERWPIIYQPAKIELSERDYLEKFIWLGRKAVRKRLNNHKTIIGLSGGLDSRLLTALASEEEIPIKTCTYGQKKSKDLVRGKQVAFELSVDHINLILEEDYLLKFAEKMVDRVDGLFSILNCHGMIFTEIADQYPVVAMANGLDQMLWSTRSHYRNLLEKDIDIVDAFFDHENEGLIEKNNWENWLTEKWYGQYTNSLYDKFKADMNRFHLDSIDDSIDSFKLYLNMGYVGASLPMITHKMEFSEPFYDNELMEFILSLPLYLRWNRKLVKMAIHHLSPTLSRVPGGHMAEDTQWQKFLLKTQKKINRTLVRIGQLQPAQVKPPSSTYNNMHYLLRTKENSNWLKKNLLDTKSILSEIIKPKIINKLVLEHINGVANHTSEIGVLLTIEFYLRIIDGYC